MNQEQFLKYMKMFELIVPKLADDFIEIAPKVAAPNNENDFRINIPVNEGDRMFADGSVLSDFDFLIMHLLTIRKRFGKDVKLLVSEYAEDGGMNLKNIFIDTVDYQGEQTCVRFMY
jgi:hypothetical protein